MDLGLDRPMESTCCRISTNLNLPMLKALGCNEKTDSYDSGTIWLNHGADDVDCIVCMEPALELININ